jgi:hypothetical protein
MRIPVIQGVIDRRMLVNFRVRPDVLAQVLPAPFRPKLLNGWGMAGICLIRLRQIRPRHLPAMIGVTSENAAHRIAALYERDGKTQEGVFVARRDSSSRFNALAGGRLFPGIHHHARFDVAETDQSFRVELTSDDSQVHLLVDAAISESLPSTSLFASLNDASAFFEAGSVGYSPGFGEGEFDGMELRSFKWNVQPLEVRRVKSSFFEDLARFPAGSVEFDCALLMRGIEHEWHDRGVLVSSSNKIA